MNLNLTAIVAIELGFATSSCKSERLMRAQHNPIPLLCFLIFEVQRKVSCSATVESQILWCLFNPTRPRIGSVCHFLRFYTCAALIWPSLSCLDF